MKNLPVAIFGSLCFIVALFYLACQQPHQPQVSTLKMEEYHMDGDTAKWHRGAMQIKAFTPYCVKPASARK